MKKYYGIISVLWVLVALYMGLWADDMVAGYAALVIAVVYGCTHEILGAIRKLHERI